MINISSVSLFPAHLVTILLRTLLPTKYKAVVSYSSGMTSCDVHSLSSK